MFLPMGTVSLFDLTRYTHLPDTPNQYIYQFTAEPSVIDRDLCNLFKYGLQITLFAKQRDPKIDDTSISVSIVIYQTTFQKIYMFHLWWWWNMCFGGFMIFYHWSIIELKIKLTCFNGSKLNVCCSPVNFQQNYIILN